MFVLDLCGNGTVAPGYKLCARAITLHPDSMYHRAVDFSEKVVGGREDIVKLNGFIWRPIVQIGATKIGVEQGEQKIGVAGPEGHVSFHSVPQAP